MNPEFSPPQYGWGCLFFFRSGSREGLSELVIEVPEVLRVFLKIGGRGCIWRGSGVSCARTSRVLLKETWLGFAYHSSLCINASAHLKNTAQSPTNMKGLLLRVRLSAPQCCNAERSDAQRNFFTSQFIPPFLQRHRCDALPSFSASPVIMFYIAHIAFPPLLPFSLSPQWFTVQNNKKFTKSHNAAMSRLATRDGHRKRKRKRSDAVH